LIKSTEENFGVFFSEERKKEIHIKYTDFFSLPHKKIMQLLKSFRETNCLIDEMIKKDAQLKLINKEKQISSILEIYNRYISYLIYIPSYVKLQNEPKNKKTRR
jgi:ABC-type microcin C transport system permease subunit YejB